MEKIEFFENRKGIEREKPYNAEMFRQVALKKLQELYKIRDLMESKGYKAEKQKFEKELERLRSIAEGFMRHVYDFEDEITGKIMNDDRLTMEQKQQKLNDEVYPKVQEIFRAVEQREDYQKALEKINELRANNSLMEASIVYDFKRTFPKTMPFVDLTKFLAGEKTEEIEFEMPSNCIYEEIAKQEKYAESGYLEDYRMVLEEDKRQKQLSKLQIEYLFERCDTICFHAEKGSYVEAENDERFAKIIKNAYKSEFVKNWGMQVLRIYLNPSKELKEYLLSFIRFDKYHYDVYESFAPYVNFADILFLKDGEPLLNCLTHEGYFDVHESIKNVFEEFNNQVNEI